MLRHTPLSKLLVARYLEYFFKPSNFTVMGDDSVSVQESHQ